MQRRDFLKRTALGTLGLVALGNIFGATKALALDLIDMTGKKRTDAANKSAMTVAKGLNYVDDTKEALKKKQITKTDRQVGAKTYTPDQQTCDTCNFYKETAAGKGTCTLIPGVLVRGPGTCNSWIPKA